MAGYHFDYTIVDVVNAINLPIRKINNSTLDVDCPICVASGRNGKGKMNVVIAKNFCHCCKCNNDDGRFGGGMLELYALVKGVDTKTAHKEMLAFIGKSDYKQTIQKSRQVYLEAKKVSQHGSKRASNEVLDKTYRAFLDECVLLEKHKKELLSPKRGLNMKQIKGLGIKSCPTHREQHKSIINNLLQKGFVLEGVPGFFIDKSGNWNFNLFRYSEGYLIPVINIKRQVVGFQVRLDEPIGKNKKTRYIWFSSAYKEKGVSSGGPIHITSGKPSKYIYLTEGPLKAYIAAFKSNKTFAAVAGVNNQKPLNAFLRELKANGTKVIVDCFDSDCIHNEYVEKARRKLAQKVVYNGLEYIRMEWNQAYKGIDDYLLNVPKTQWNFRW